MYPKYLEDDTIILEVTREFYSGQDCLVYLHSYDKTLKTVIKNKEGIKPINPHHPPKTYGKKDEEIKILGIAKQIRKNLIDKKIIK